MKSAHRNLFFLTLLTALFVSAKFLYADTDLYPFPKVDEIKIKKPKETKPVDVFARNLSKRIGVTETAISDALAKGFGRAELIRLILISKKSDTPLDDLLKEREKGTRLAKIAESKKQDNRSIRKEALALLKELEDEESESKSKMEAAGTGEHLTKDDTHYRLQDSTGSNHKKEN